MRGVSVLVSVFAAIVAAALSPAGAQTPKKTPVQAALSAKLNESTVSVVSGKPDGTYLTIAYDLSTVLDSDQLRILPIVGKGGAQNIHDVLFLKGVDMGITQANILAYFRKTGEVGPIDDRILYVARLFNEEMHILARPEIETIADLRGKKVNFSDVGSGTQATTRLVFDLLDVGAEEVDMGQNDAFEQLETGAIVATILIAGKPAGAYIRAEREGGLHLLQVPYSKALEADYFPASLTSEDYPNLIDKGETVDTIAVSAVLAVYNWPRGTERYRRLTAFVGEFFAKIDEFQKPPRHPKWKEVDLAAVLPGWKRFKPAEEWLDQASQPGGGDAEVKQRFDVFLSERGVATTPDDPADRNRLFQDFLLWSKARGR